MTRLRQQWREAGAAGVFVVSSFALGAACWLGLGALHAPLFDATVVAMLSPLAATLLAGAWGGYLPARATDLVAGFARALRPSRTGLLAVAIVAALLVAGMAITTATGAGGAAPAVRAWSPAVLALGFLLYLLPACAEELGWRGFLLNRMSGLHPATAAALVGLLWGVWHAPAIAGRGFDYGSYRLPGVVAMCLVTVPFGVILAWLRHRSGSLFAPALGHALFNALVAPAVAVMSHSNMLLVAPMGLLGAIPMAGLAVWLVAAGRFDSPRSAVHVGILVPAPSGVHA